MEEKNKSYTARLQYKNADYARNYDFTRYQRDKRRQKRDISTQKAIALTLGRLSGCETILDMPCGTGRFLKLISDAGYTYYGSDVSKEMLDVCLEKTPTNSNPHFICADGEDMPFSSETFDCVLCVRFLNLIPPDVRARIVKELFRISRKYLVVSVGYFGTGRRFKDRIVGKFPWLFKKAHGKAVEHARRRHELFEAGWRESFWVKYKSRGFFSSNKMIGVYTKDMSNR